MLVPSPGMALARRLIVALALLVAVAAAQASSQLTIYNDSKKYGYYGCYNETTEIPGSDHTRALGGGINEVKRGEMTVPMCLAFCSNGDTQYRYAGLEWARECWCSQSIAGISKKLDDNQCNFPCEGDNTTACGASLKLSVYRLSSPAARITGPAVLACVGAALAVLL
ncbi:carbohydrate-binding WSC [Purpureocillium lavendulum]|uniref:Carbohydrate-binding WSC n=1 Tax=Purpureocillium lavendulum TaxID=1247861 RepID=A0AB34G367_9HYPO|nr:carbohydrate-binding WSC [Purpureocillium lavendulum]